VARYLFPMHHLLTTAQATPNQVPAILMPKRRGANRDSLSHSLRETYAWNPRHLQLELNAADYLFVIRPFATGLPLTRQSPPTCNRLLSGVGLPIQQMLLLQEVVLLVEGQQARFSAEVLLPCDTFPFQ
jgi:hypothetical protein